MDERRRFDEQRELLMLLGRLKGKWVGYNGEWWHFDSMPTITEARLIQVRDSGGGKSEQVREILVNPQDVVNQNAELIQAYKNATVPQAVKPGAGSPETHPLTVENEIEDQYKLITDYLDEKIASFVFEHNNRYPDREEAIRFFQEVQDVLKRTGFYKKDFLAQYFAEHGDRFLVTGKFFSFKTDNAIATFELLVSRQGNFELRAQKGTDEGALAQKIMDADNSGKTEF